MADPERKPREDLAPQLRWGIAMGQNNQLLGRRIKAARALRGVSQDQLAEKTMLNRTALSRAENGQRIIAAVEIANIADVLQLPLSWFFEEFEDTRVKRRGKASSLHSVPTLPEVIGPEPTSVQPPLAVSVH